MDQTRSVHAIICSLVNFVEYFLFPNGPNTSDETKKRMKYMIVYHRM